MPIEFWLGELPDARRSAAEAVLAIVRRYRGLVVEAVSVGVLIKRERTIVELRPRTRWLDLSFVSKAVIASDRIARRLTIAAGNVYVVHLHDVRDVDRELRGWLATALRPDAATRPSPRPRRRARRRGATPGRARARAGRPGCDRRRRAWRGCW